MSQLTCFLGLATRSPEQQIFAIFDIASELSMPFCRSMVQQIFEQDPSSAEHSSDGLSAALLNAIKSALEKDQPSGLELLATLDSALTDKVSLMTALGLKLYLLRLDTSACRTQDH